MSFDLEELFRDGLDVAVLIPCYNESVSVGKVVKDFRSALPNATIYVYDNNSTDGTADIARAAGAIVRAEYRQGKGYVVCRMFADIEADIFIMVDGDDTYDADAAPRMIEKLISDQLDVVNAARDQVSASAYRPGHRSGNTVLSYLVRIIFGAGFTDMLSGYRALSRRFVKSFSAISQGFEIETELTIHALDLKMPIGEVRTMYQSRAPGSNSKLHSIPDGIRIFWTIVSLLKQERPLEFFSALAAVFAIASLVLFYPVLLEYAATGLVPRFPTAILSGIIMLLAFLCIGCGLVLDTVTRGRQEAKRMRYLAEASLSSLLMKRKRGRQKDENVATSNFFVA